jgi:hypothetical protein
MRAKGAFLTDRPSLDFRVATLIQFWVEPHRHGPDFAIVGAGLVWHLFGMVRDACEGYKQNRRLSSVGFSAVRR